MLVSFPCFASPPLRSPSFWDFPYFSVFPLGEVIYGFNISGAKYPLEDHILTPYDSLCVSNQFEEEEVTISAPGGTVKARWPVSPCPAVVSWS